MNTFADYLKENINIHDLAIRLDVTRTDNKLYVAVWRGEKMGSVKVNAEGSAFCDHGNGRKGGSVIDFMMQARGLSFNDALDELAKMYSLGHIQKEYRTRYSQQLDQPKQKPAGKKADWLFLWNQSRKHKDLSIATGYLSNERKIPADALKKLQYGFSDYAPANAAAQHGNAVVFPIQDIAGKVIAHNLCYLAKKHPVGKRITDSCSGGFYSPWQFKYVKTRTVICLVESPIDAMTICAAGTAAIAFLSASYIDSFPIDWIQPTTLVKIWPDKDDAGKQAAHSLYHRLLSAGRTAQIVDVEKIEDAKDANEILTKESENPIGPAGIAKVKEALSKPSTQLFPTGIMPYIPTSEHKRLWSYQLYTDHTTGQKREKGEDGTFDYVGVDIAGFRPYRLDPITIYPIDTAMHGETGDSPQLKSVLLYRRAEYPGIQKAVIESDAIGKAGTWEKFGIVHSGAMLKKIAQTLSRDHDHHHETVNVIGNVRLGDRVQLNDAQNTYLDVEICIYHDVVHDDIPRAEAAHIFNGLNDMMTGHRAVLPLVWALGANLKVYLGFWPHFFCQAPSKSGKSTMLKVLSYLAQVKNFGHTAIKTDFQQMKMVGNHMRPVIVDEFSRAKKFGEALSRWVDLLNLSYDFNTKPHRDNMFALSGAAAMFGQDMPIEDSALTTKTIQIDLMDAKRGEAHIYRPNTRFPIRAFVEFINATQTQRGLRDKLRQHSQDLETMLANQGLSDGNDIGRFVDNYAALAVAADLICEFAGITDLPSTEDKNTAPSPSLYQSIINYCYKHAMESRMVRCESYEILHEFAERAAMRGFEVAISLYTVNIDKNLVYTSTTNILRFLQSEDYSGAVSTSKMLLYHLRRDGFLLDTNKSHRFGIKKSRTAKYTSKAITLDYKKLVQAGIEFQTFGDERDQEELL